MTSKMTSESEKDMVYLHVLPRQTAGSVVNVSPFAIKLELWLRINDIKFQTIDDTSFSRKGQSPFIISNGEQLPDSNMIVAYLSRYFDKDPFPGLSQDNIYYRYVENVEEYAQHFALALPLDERIKRIELIKTQLSKRAHAHGIGRHTPEEIYEIGCQDI